jgi:plastocyanin
MRKSIRIAVLLLFFSFLGLAPFGLSELYGAEEKSSDMNAVMLAFSQAIKALDSELAGSDAEAVLPHAEALKTAAREMPNVSLQKNKDMIQLFNEYRTTMGRLASEMASLAREASLTEARQVMEEIRSTCIACHVRFRDRNNERGLFPALRNVITGDVEIMKQNGEKRTERSNVLVFLDRTPSDAWKAPPGKRLVISQKNRTFTPRVLPIVKGTTVDFPNDDNIFHNVFSLSKTRPFDLDIYPPGTSKLVTFPKTGWVKVYCNIHPDMLTHIIVLDNPFFCLTDQKGIFVIPDVPDGEYALRTWYEYGEETRTEIKISGGLLHSYALQVQEDKKFVQHKNKFGEPYRGKYE